MQEKWKKAEKEVERTRAAYTSALSGLDADNPRYLEEMAAVSGRRLLYSLCSSPACRISFLVPNGISRFSEK